MKFTEKYKINFAGMDNPGYQGDVEKGTELSVVPAKALKKAMNGANDSNVPSTSCKPEVCRAARQRFSAPELSASPWHAKKTYFLIGTIALLGLWVIVYTTLSHLRVL